MQLPSDLQEALEREVSACSPQELKAATVRMTHCYRDQRSSAALFQERAAQCAYLAVRMPATYAAIVSVLKEVRIRLDDEPLTFLDLGAGPGTASWAAVEVFPSLQSIECVEKSSVMIEIGRRLADSSSSPLLRQAKWHCQDVRDPLPKASLVLLSYLIAELSLIQAKSLLERLWQDQTPVIIVIEPGTPEGFRRILEIREWALSQGASLFAPCPHLLPCPMKSSDWCHFPARVERTRAHKWLKEGSMGYEDEKYSYLAFGRAPASLPFGRVVGPPRKQSGFVRFPLCKEGMIQEVIISRKQAAYRAARDLGWGSSWNEFGPGEREG